MDTKGIEMRQRANSTISTAAIALVALLAWAPVAAAHGDEAHTHPVAGGGGAMPPAAAAGEGAPAAAPAEGAPAAGAQPAAPQAEPATGAANAAGVGMVETTTPRPAAAAAVAPATDRAATTPAVAPVASGGGSHEGHADPMPVAAGGGDATTPAAPAPTPSGELPFTGVEEHLLLISLAGMLVPIGVLLYCAARRGDLRRLREHLARPRFEWTPY